MIPRSLHRLPRWTLPLGGAILLACLFVLDRIGGSVGSAAFPTMAALTVVALFLALAIPDVEDEDRRAELPITMALVWAVLYVVKTGLFLGVLMAGSWVALIFFVGYALIHDYERRWIAVAALDAVLLNIVLLFALWRP